MESRSFQYGSSSIFYHVAGSGKPLLLLHGFGEDGSIWSSQAECLKAHFRLIIPDLPGSGHSELLPDMSIEGMAEVIKEICTLEGFGSPLQGAEGVVLLGHSMGGHITLAFAEKYPEWLSSFGLVHSSAYADSEERKQVRRKSIDFIKRNGAYEFLKMSKPGLFGGAWSMEHGEIIEALIAKGENFSSEALISYYQAMIERPDRTHVLKDFKGAVLFIMGEQDTAVSFEHSLQQCHIPQRSEVCILRHSAHMGMLEEAEKVNHAILKFIEEIIGPF